MYKVIQWATGSIGRTALRRIIDHPDLDLVGLYVYDPRKVGRDAGEIARRPPTGVFATNDIEKILALDADVVIHASRISLPYTEQNAEIERLLAAGKNVISVNGFYVPQVHGESYAAPLRAACARGSSTLAGMGLNPGFIGERLALALTGLCAQLDFIGAYETVDCSYIPAPDFVFKTMGFGVDPAAGDIARGELAQLYTDLYAETFAYVAAALGTQVQRLLPDHQFTVAPNDINIAAGTVKKGTVAATEWRWHAEFADGRRMTHSVLWTSSLRLHSDDEAVHWRIEIKGRPNVSLHFALHDPDPAVPPSRTGADATAALLIRGIPDVCAAPPGFFSYAPPVAFKPRF